MRALRNPAAVRRNNMELLLDLIESTGPISRAELSRVTGLSQPTVCAGAEGLARAGLIRVQGAGDSTGGRRPVLLRFNPGAGYAIGVDLGGTSLKLALTDLGGRVVHRLDEPTPNPKSGPASAVAAIIAAVERLVQEAEVRWEEVLGLGVGAPGATDAETGQVTLAPAVGWEQTPVKQLLSERFRVPCRVENDVNAAALAEILFGRGKELADFVFVAIGTGIGAGIVIDGKLHRGRHCAAGEVGYLVIDHAWRPETVGGFGCFESMAAAPAIARKAREVIPELADGGPAGEVEALFGLARQGHPAANRVVDEIAGYMGAALANLAVTLDPAAIILGGGVSRAGEVLIEPVRRKLQELSPLVPEVCVSSLGAEAGMLGAAALAVEAAKERLLSAV
ncbi:MAG: ROK family transcriptional regulator [Chitinophagales bacterium]